MPCWIRIAIPVTAISATPHLADWLPLHLAAGQRRSLRAGIGFLLSPVRIPTLPLSVRVVGLLLVLLCSALSCLFVCFLAARTLINPGNFVPELSFCRLFKRYTFLQLGFLRPCLVHPKTKNFSKFSSIKYR